jgi:hypothetical protein
MREASGAIVCIDRLGLVVDPVPQLAEGSSKCLGIGIGQLAEDTIDCRLEGAEALFHGRPAGRLDLDHGDSPVGCMGRALDQMFGLESIDERGHRAR